MDLLDSLEDLSLYFVDKILLEVNPDEYRKLMSISGYAFKKYTDPTFFNQYYQKHVHIEEEYIDDNQKNIKYFGSVKYGTEEWFKIPPFVTRIKLYKIIPWKNGFKDGIEEKYAWWSPNETVERRRYWSEGALIKKENYHNNGNLKSIINFIRECDSQLHQWKKIKNGEEIEYYMSGPVKLIKKWVNGLQDGREEEFYLNGSPARNVSWKNGKKNGSEKYFFEANIISPATKTSLPIYENSKLMSIMRYENGLFHGDYERFNQAGFRYFLTQWDHGRKNGIEEEWYDYGRGRKKYMMTWENGKLIKEEHY